MTSHANLLRDGYELVAERVQASFRYQRGNRVLVVRNDGKVRIYIPHECSEPVSFIVGTYSRQARIEDIENDLIARLREINQQAAA